METNLSSSPLFYPQGFQSEHKNGGDTVDLSEERVWTGPKGVNVLGTSNQNRTSAKWGQWEGRFKLGPPSGEGARLDNTQKLKQPSI